MIKRAFESTQDEDYLQLVGERIEKVELTWVEQFLNLIEDGICGGTVCPTDVGQYSTESLAVSGGGRGK